MKIKWNSRWSDYIFSFPGSTTEYVDMGYGYNDRKYNSNSDKKIVTVLCLLSRKHAKSEDSCWDRSYFKTISLVKEIP